MPDHSPAEPCSWRIGPVCRRTGARSLAGVVTAAALLLWAVAPAAAQTAIVTHHYDASRSGWNATETVLTQTNVGTPGVQGTFGRLTTVPLDGPVDAQPLVVPGVVIAGDPNAGKHDVVYVATQNNTVFAIDPVAGTVLLTRNFGTTNGRSRGCGAGDAGVGITGTPVIDVARSALYVVAYTREPIGTSKYFQSVYRLHMLDLATLADKIAPMVITGRQTLTDGSTLTFVPGQHRQRPALLEYGGTIYTAFGSFCDNNPARGWVMGWSADTLAPLEPGPNGTAIANVTNRQTTEPSGRFLSTIWMSGAGPAADANGIYYVTGNSDPSATRYDPSYNLEHSVVRISTDTTQVLDVFTPSNLPFLAGHDTDFGAGGAMLLPSAGPGQPPMIAAAGKFGTLYLLDRSRLGGYTPGGPDAALAEVPIGVCWCAPAYFDDGIPTLVSSGGHDVKLWSVQATPTTALVPRATGVMPTTGDDPGFFTSVSSHGTKNAIVWAVTRPVSADQPNVYLVAFRVPYPGGNAVMRKLFIGQAGTWSAMNHNANIVPVVANGRVYVASDQGLAVFGLAPPSAGAVASGE